MHSYALSEATQFVPGDVLARPGLLMQSAGSVRCLYDLVQRVILLGGEHGRR